MAYSKYTLEEVEQVFSLGEKTESLFDNVQGISPTGWLLETLQKAQFMPTKSEKARSELIITPILLTIAEMNKETITIFSGENLEADIEKGLNGECDYILSRNPKSFSLKAPIFGLVEAKQNIVENSMGQCAAQMLGAQIFNQKRGNNITKIYGCVSNGDVWQFLKLVQNELSIDTKKCYIDNLSELLGVLQYIINDK
ncbi:MAG: hypothetical protein H7A23_07915 [Leptospiraceae bacterium]|nr:hypothetical protein [Leptospiraceae bacterium]MCP5494469.1 hypothetical protein [Leptospiraceae bacterium]